MQLFSLAVAAQLLPLATNVAVVVGDSGGDMLLKAAISVEATEMAATAAILAAAGS